MRTQVLCAYVLCVVDEGGGQGGKISHMTVCIDAQNGTCADRHNQTRTRLCIDEGEKQ